MKVAVVGAGSYVFGPSVLAQTYFEQQLSDVHLALVDPDMQTIELLAAVARRMADERGLSTVVTTHTERLEAFAGADFVICSASPQMQRRTIMDYAIVDEHLPGHLKTEFGGIAGISYSLRQIALIEAITADMRRLCPDAWLLDVSNPLPRVCQAAHEAGIRTIGFCSAAQSAYAMLSDLFGRGWPDWPFAAARERWSIASAGLNHFAWLLEFRDRATGQDLLPELRIRLADGNISPANPRAQQFVRDTGYLLVPGDDHTRDFLPPLRMVAQDEHDLPWHGNPAQREERHGLLRRLASGGGSYAELLRGEAWEKPMQFIAAITGHGPARFDTLNLVNEAGQIPSLPAKVFVETPCQVSEGRADPVHVELPAIVRSWCDRTALITDTIVRAATERSVEMVHAAVELDPTILDKAAGIKAIDACLRAHADLLPAYS